jgi:hypothetical protein
MTQGIGIYYYALFKTTAPDQSAFFGIVKTQNPSYGQDGIPFSYIGTGAKLRAKARQFGIGRLTTEVMLIDPSYDNVKKRLDGILTPATLRDPLCLNMPQTPREQKISEAMTGVPKSELHKENIAMSMAGNQNAIGHVVSEEHKAIISEANRKKDEILDAESVKMVWIHNKNTAEELQFPKDEDVLTGFELGRLPKELKSKFKKDRKAELTDAERAKLIRD